MKFLCPNCDATLNGPAKTVGRSVKCPKCKQPFVASIRASEEQFIDQTDLLPDQDSPTEAATVATSKKDALSKSSLLKYTALSVLGVAASAATAFWVLDRFFPPAKIDLPDVVAVSKEHEPKAVEKAPALELPSIPTEAAKVERPARARLSDFNIADLVSRIEKDPEDGLKQLALIETEPNAKISQAIYDAAWDDRIGKTELLNVVPDWIGQPQMEQTIARYQDEKFLLPFILKTLEQHPIPAGTGIIEKVLLGEGKEVESAIALLESKYPKYVNSCITTYLDRKQANRFSSYGSLNERLARCLGRTGNLESIPILERMGQMMFNKGNDDVLDAIKKIRERHPSVESIEGSELVEMDSEISRPLLCNAPPNLTPFGYEIAVKVYPSEKDDDQSQVADSGRKREQVWNGKAVFSADTRQISSMGRTSRDRKRWSREWITGLGVPGKRVLTSSLSIAGASKLFVHIDGKKYPAEIDKELPHGVVLLSHDGPDFPAVLADDSGLTFVDYPMVLSIDNYGEIVKHYPRVNIPVGNLPTISIRGGRPRARPFVTIQPDPLPHQACGGIIIQPWGRIGGLLVESNDSSQLMFRGSRIVSVASFADRIRDAKCFDVEAPSNTYSFDSVESSLGKNLVRVEIERDPDKGSVMAMRYDLELISQSRIPVKRDPMERVFFPPVRANHGMCYLNPFGKLVHMQSDRSKLEQLQMPALLGDVNFIPFIGMLSDDKKEWQSERKFSIVPRGDFFCRKEIANDSDWRRVPESARGYERSSTKIVDNSDQEANLERQFSIFSESKLSIDGTVEPPMLLVEGVQKIRFDKVKGLVAEAVANGTFEYADSRKLSFEFEFRLLDDQTAAGRFRTQTAKHAGRPRKVRDSPARVDPRQELTDELRGEILQKIQSEERRNVEEGLVLLATCYPTKDPKFSQLLCENLESFAAFRVKRLLLYWVLPTDMPKLLSVWRSLDKLKKQDALISESVLSLVELHPRVPANQVDAIKELLQGRFSPQVSRILARQYPELIEPMLLPLLGADWVNVDLVKFLGKHGTQKSVEVLSRLKSRPELMSNQKNIIDEAIKSIAARNN